MKYIIPAFLFAGLVAFSHTATAIETATLEIKGRSIPENSISVSETTGIKPTPVTYSPTVTKENTMVVIDPAITPPPTSDVDVDGGGVRAGGHVIQYSESNLEFIKREVPTPSSTPVSVGEVHLNGTIGTSKVTPPPSRPKSEHNGASDASAGKGDGRTVGDSDNDPLNISVKGSGLKKLHLEAKEGDSSKKVGVQGWDPKKKEEIIGSPHNVRTPEELSVYVEAVALNDARISDISVSRSSVEIQSAEKGKLFWFIPVQMTRVITVNIKDGEKKADRVKVKFPWYHVFVKKTETSEALKSEVSTRLDTWEWESVDSSQSMTDAARISHILQLVSGILKTKHDTVKNSTGNVR